MTDRHRPSPPRTLTPWLAAVALGLAGVALAGCGADDGAGADAPAASAVEATGDVEFEPAFPEEVSSEGLTTEDVRQQEAAHGHGDEAHAHDDEGDAHAHDDEDHAHDGEEEDHDHGEDGHAH